MQQRILERRPGKLIMLADYEDEEMAEILEVAAIAVQALSIVSIFQNKILVKYSYQYKTCTIPLHNFVLSGPQYTDKLLDSQSKIHIIVYCRYCGKFVFSSLYGKLYFNIQVTKQGKIKKNY